MTLDRSTSEASGTWRPRALDTISLLAVSVVALRTMVCTAFLDTCFTPISMGGRGRGTCSVVRECGLMPIAS